jgi:hypothetical protein
MRPFNAADAKDRAERIRQDVQLKAMTKAAEPNHD